MALSDLPSPPGRSSVRHYAPRGALTQAKGKISSDEFGDPLASNHYREHPGPKPDTARPDQSSPWSRGSSISRTRLALMERSTG